MMTMKGLWAHVPLIWLFLLLTLSGCTLLPASPPVTFYRLPSPTQAPTQIPTQVSGMELTLRITRPETSGLLAGTRIAVVPQDNQLSAYQGVRWVSPVPVLWRDQVIEAFQQDGRFRYVGSDEDSWPVDLELGGVLRAFQAEYRQGRPVVVIRFDARLLDPHRRTILASRRFEVRETPQGAEVPAVVAAFGVAHERLARELLDWLPAARRR
ncbi:cholesterol transport system auxiliary component [Oceanisphaera litoralis]|uniref:ABC-type transport auxiliary lipoprotein family protein n=1 Tax=Oceanisphaera litoralis TaxID=225144 RepID=UPI001EF9529D|nr:ABC-type transport auxiliary lipoprotein family protein [Oceanisphaera litoralis]MBM7455556.1 cholesterol transport system auxiliary component [Oceanisphaera litoralis]